MESLAVNSKAETLFVCVECTGHLHTFHARDLHTVTTSKNHNKNQQKKTETGGSTWTLIHLGPFSMSQALFLVRTSIEVTSYDQIRSKSLSLETFKSKAEVSN